MPIAFSRPPRRLRAAMLATCAVALAAAGCAGHGSSPAGSSSGGLSGSRFTLMLQSTANANKVVEVHAVNELKKQGVDASVKWNDSSPNIAITQLKTGDIDAYSEAVTGGVSAVEAGVQLKDFALAQPRQDYVFLSKDIAGLADLRGKKIGVQDTTGVNYAQALLLVQKAGLTPKDVSIIAVGGQSSRLPALVAGRVDVTMLSHAAQLQLEPKGFKTVMDLTKEAPNLYDDNVFATPGWLAKNEPLAVAFNKALLDSYVWFNDPANTDAVVNEALQIQPAADRAQTAQLFTMLRQANAYPVGTILDPGLLDQQQKLYLQAGALKATAPVTQWADASYARKAKGSGQK
ncbi:ABC transporter substrate-binding protein [Amycolatopsis sp. FDAARGOS 1241]|uniref:ABC transporter substrate-binding protein n=1 Tax=Amycolatopsis sp. FDAARGOS 1241 TaxID=2778070 RepID=UPI00195256D1|nr:ABC transporter substrate-binding protein [Amycolatopsis sp. FDAARGOS 1241]QRP48662.1 ABC transporter substrate-binding protein [Amycolatopsis sp. FDAARGOS 1241]